MYLYYELTIIFTTIGIVLRSNNIGISKRPFYIIKSLKEKNCFYMKSDKGNSLVILSKTQYETRMEKLISDGSYENIVKDPLNKMVKESRDAISLIKSAFGENIKWSLYISNPEVPKLYGLPKIHKLGEKMRPIVSNINSPFYNLAKWLTKELNCLPHPQGLSVKNSFEFVDKIKDIQLQSNEILVSFDVEALFPSIPIDVALLNMEDWLIINNIELEKRDIYLKVAKTCMRNSFFQYRDKFYKLTSGTAMGNPLSPFLSECFMTTFETKLQDHPVFPRFWCRYVDDVCAIVEKDKIDEVLNLLNSEYDTINFTIETEDNGKLPFLDLLLTIQNGKIDFSVYRKPTNTMRYITVDSSCPIQHKMAAFHSMVFRLCKLPLSAKNYMDELSHIKQVATVNGYSNNFVDILVKKHSKEIKRSSQSTFFSNVKSEDIRRVKVSYCHKVQSNRKIGKVFKKNNMKVVHPSRNKLGSLLGSLKDQKDMLRKSGIYEIKCDNCSAIYIGKTKRNLLVRYKEHKGHAVKNRPEKSAVAKHLLENDHCCSICNIKLKKEINDARRLDAYESFFISKHNGPLMNNDHGNIESPLFGLI